MSVSTTDIVFSPSQSSATLTVKLCSDAPSGATSTRIMGDPQLSEIVTINGINYPPGSPSITYSGGTVYSTSPLVVEGATVSTVGPVWINGSYSSSTKIAAVTISSGSIPERSQVNYGFWFVNSTGATVSGSGPIVTGMIYKKTTTDRIPISNTGLVACGITVS